jgi:HTH-type transcriptional regulator, sugar sensing transcriptional regulator
MIVDGEFLSRLRKIFDLNLYEVKVWTSLLSRGVSTAGELSNISDVPRSRTYDILESLEKKGFIVMKLGKPIKFIALKPEEVIERVKKNLVTHAYEKAKRLDGIKKNEVLGELTNLYTQGIEFVEPADMSGSIKGRQNVYNHLDMMLKNAKKDVVVVTTAEGLNRKIEALKSTIEKARKRGVIVKVAAPITADNYKVAKELSKVADVRALSKEQGRFAIVDGEQMMFMLLDDKTVHPNYDVGVWLASEFFAKSLGHMFVSAWKDFTPLNKVKIK